MIVYVFFVVKHVLFILISLKPNQVSTFFPFFDPMDAIKGTLLNKIVQLPKQEILPAGNQSFPRIRLPGAPYVFLSGAFAGQNHPGLPVLKMKGDPSFCGTADRPG